jgi:predicted dehydrogenase
MIELNVQEAGAPPAQAALLAATAGGPARRARTRLRIAVVGCGYWGSKHVRVLSAVPGVRSVAIVESDAAVCARMRHAFPAALMFPSLEAALPHVDAVVIATPPETHAALATTAMRAGRHVLVEKPLSTSVEQAHALVREARRSRTLLMVGHTFQFNPAVRELRRRLTAGEFGDIYYIHSARLNLGLYRPDVNVVWDLAPHDISILNYLIGSPPRAVTAWGASLAFGGVEDLAYIRLEYENPRVTGYAHLSWLDPRKTRTVTVVGSRKMAVYDDLAEERLRIYDRGVSACADGTPLHERPPTYHYGDIVAPHIRADEPLALQDSHFVECILDRREPEASGVEALAIVAALEAIDRSMQLRTRVTVATIPGVSAAPAAASAGGGPVPETVAAEAVR